MDIQFSHHLLNDEPCQISWLYMWGFILGLSILLLYVSFYGIPHCFNYHSCLRFFFFCHCFLTVPLIFKKQVLPSGNVKPSILVNLQDCHYSGSLKIPCGFLNRWFCLSKALRILIEFALNPWTTLGSINISAIFLQSINIRHFSICVMLDFFRQGFGISACKSFLSPGLSYA